MTPEQKAAFDGMRKVVSAVYSGIAAQTEPTSDAEALRAIADWMDKVDDAADEMMAHPTVPDRLRGHKTREGHRTFQDRLREIAANLT